MAFSNCRLYGHTLGYVMRIPTGSVGNEVLFTARIRALRSEAMYHPRSCLQSSSSDLWDHQTIRPSIVFAVARLMDTQFWMALIPPHSTEGNKKGRKQRIQCREVQLLK